MCGNRKYAVENRTREMQTGHREVLLQKAGYFFFLWKKAEALEVTKGMAYNIYRLKFVCATAKLERK